MKDWFWTYGWKFVLALLVVAAAMAFLVHLEELWSPSAVLLVTAAR
ncbi:MAG: hypothetical protein JWM31_1726 [Solirubrobacterales bacterium]|nr:hypothetical protein [Solirubrobacterales bacterium]